MGPMGSQSSPFPCTPLIQGRGFQLHTKETAESARHIRCEAGKELLIERLRWLGSQVVSVLDSGAEGPGFKSLSSNSLMQTVHTHRASVHQAAKLVAALLKVARVTVGLAECYGSLPLGL